MDSFRTRQTLHVGSHTYTYYSLKALAEKGFQVSRLPYSLKIVLENLLRNEDGLSVSSKDIEELCRWDAKAAPSKEIAFMPARVLMQDFTGVPAIVDLASMRDAVAAMGKDPAMINPITPVELVIDHSLQVDYYGSPDAEEKNTALEFSRNEERYRFLKWGQQAFSNLRVVPPGMGIVHQVNLEYLARVVMTLNEGTPSATLCPDTVVGTDSHTTMINGLGVLGWGVGGIEAEACMLGQATSMLIPQVVGVRFVGKLPAIATATDLVLTVTERLRKLGVVGKFVEFFGPGLGSLSLADRATIANMAPEYGATCGLFPVDEKTLEYLRLSGRPADLLDRVEAYFKAQGLFYSPELPEPEFSAILEIDLSQIEPSLAGPKRPQDRVPLSQVKASVDSLLPAANPLDTSTLDHGSVVIAAITSCTNTSNPAVLFAAGLLAQKAVARGLKSKPWVKTSLAPGSKVVVDYLSAAGLLGALEQLGFHTVGYGCTTCIGNSGPLHDDILKTIDERQLLVASVLSGNRNFEGRVHAKVKANFLASPPLVVAYALAGSTRIDLTQEPLGVDQDGKPVMLSEIWPSPQEIQSLIQKHIGSELYAKSYAHIFQGSSRWRALEAPSSMTYAWDEASTYIRKPNYFDALLSGQARKPALRNMRALALLGDSITTDHISPAGNIATQSPAGAYLRSHGVATADFNQYGARRGNHEVMMRGTFANVRLKNLMVPGVEGGVTQHQPSQETLSIYDAAMRYQSEETPTLVLAGQEYGTGSSRDWAAKGPQLLGVKAVVAQSYERIHRSNLVGMGVLPLEFLPGQSAQSLGLDGTEMFSIRDAAQALTKPLGKVTVEVMKKDGRSLSFEALVRIDTPQELLYYHEGGILPYVLKRRLSESQA